MGGIAVVSEVRRRNPPTQCAFCARKPTYIALRRLPTQPISFECLLLGYFCAHHWPPRQHGIAAYRLAAQQCSAQMRDGLPCTKAAHWRVYRGFTRTNSLNCHWHLPPDINVELGHVEIMELDA